MYKAKRIFLFLGLGPREYQPRLMWFRKDCVSVNRLELLRSSRLFPLEMSPCSAQYMVPPSTDISSGIVMDSPSSVLRIETNDVLYPRAYVR